MFILGYEGENPLSEKNKGFISALNSGLGGVIFFTQNIKSRDSFKKAVNDIKVNSLIKPFLSIDQEGGRVERTQNIYNGTKYCSSNECVKRGLEFTMQQTSDIAKDLKDLGLNMNFAPVLDVNTNPHNPIIGERSFSDNPEIVSKYGKVVSEIYLRNGIIPVGKHFPGHGDTAVDSHKEMPYVGLPLYKMEEIHMKPFASLVNVLPAIMIAHVHYSCFDKEEIPASVSSNVIQGYLRKNLGFKGLVVSDDMVMGGIKKFSSLQACIMAINAGVNMFIFRNSDEKTLCLFDELEKATEEGIVNIENINKSVEIIKRIKCC